MSELKELFTNTYPTSDPSPLARDRVVEMALAADRRTTQGRTRSQRLRFGFGIGFASLVVGGGILMAPSITTASYVRRVGALVKDAQSAHIVEWAPTPGGGRKRVRELWYQGGRWRIDAPMFESVTLADGMRQWVYSPSRKSVTVTALRGGFIGGKGFTLTSMLSGQPRGSQVRISGSPGIKTVVFENSIDHSKTTMWINERTDYPISGKVETVTPNGQKTALLFECEFNHPIAPDRFSTKFPSGTKVVDAVSGARFWQRELSRSMASFKVDSPAGKDKLVVRDVQLTEGGDVFMLYTGPQMQDGISVTDDLGNTYVRCDGFQPQAYRMNDESQKIEPEEGIRVDGAALNGMWWTPLAKPGEKVSARTINFSFAAIWYRADAEKMKHWPKDKPVPMTEMTKMTSPVGKWSVRMTGPSSGVVPDYMPYMGIGPKEIFDVDQRGDDARLGFLISAGRFEEAEPVLRNAIARIEGREALTGQSWAKGGYYFKMYQTLKAQGRDQEARPWLAKVRNEPSGGISDPAIGRALEAEGL